MKFPRQFKEPEKSRSSQLQSGTPGRALFGNDPWALEEVRGIGLRHHGLRFGVIVVSFFVSIHIRHHADQLPTLIRESF
jgi:hypothetical protein